MQLAAIFQHIYSLRGLAECYAVIMMIIIDQSKNFSIITLLLNLFNART